MGVAAFLVSPPPPVLVCEAAAPRWKPRHRPTSRALEALPDGRFLTLEAVVDHYDDHLGLQLSDDQKKDLIEYLESI